MRWRGNITGWSEAMSDHTQRFDVVYHSNHTTIDAHFCRSWEPNETGEIVGCYGTNPSHGYSLEEACEQVAEWYAQQAALWRARQHPDCLWFTQDQRVIAPVDASRKSD